jgi:hypothetical protein
MIRWVCFEGWLWRPRVTLIAGNHMEYYRLTQVSSRMCGQDRHTNGISRSEQQSFIGFNCVLTAPIIVLLFNAHAPGLLYPKAAYPGAVFKTASQIYPKSNLWHRVKSRMSNHKKFSLSPNSPAYPTCKNGNS